MTTQEVAEQLVNYCRQGQFTEAQTNLYHHDTKSIEPEGSGWPTIEGMEAITAKAEQWSGMVEEVHGVTISDPVVAGNFFSISMANDVTFKEGGRMLMEEICVYEAQNGKIVSEQFFFTPPPQ